MRIKDQHKFNKIKQIYQIKNFNKFFVNFKIGKQFLRKNKNNYKLKQQYSKKKI